MTKDQMVTVVTKPEMERSRTLGKLISYLEENGLDLKIIGPVVKLNLIEIKDTYSLMGLVFDKEEEESWEIGTGNSFVLGFSSPKAHTIIDDIAPHKHFPVIYVKKAQ